MVQIQSDYYTIDNFNSKFSKSCADFHKVNANIRSFTKNIYNLLNYAIILTETWLNDDNKDLANIPGYIGFHTIWLNKRSGRVSVRDDLNAVINKDLCLKGSSRQK